MESGRPLEVEDALQYLIQFIRGGPKPQHGSLYGYGVYLPTVARHFLIETGLASQGLEKVWHERRLELTRAFGAAAWDLCRRGILRPGLEEFQTQTTADGGGGGGFSLTPHGEEWIRGVLPAEIPLEPDRLGRMLAEAGGRFGTGYLERSQEAVRSYRALAYLACCAMCGAAAESILLALAIGKSGDERRTLSVYVGNGGRGRIQAGILQGQAKPVQDEFHRYVELLKYWRDSSAHGRAVRISEAEAWTSLALLLRFARWAEDRWQELTA